MMCVCVGISSTLLSLSSSDTFDDKHYVSYWSCRMKSGMKIGFVCAPPLVSIDAQGDTSVLVKGEAGI